MDNIDQKVLRDLCHWRAVGWRATLVTVVHTWGSSPRPVGAMMAIRGDGHCVGSVSGGCIEDDLIHRYAISGSMGQTFAKPTLLRYGVSADEAHRFGLPCGGTVEVLMEFDPSHATLEKIIDQLKDGKLVRRIAHCGDGRVTFEATNKVEELLFDGQHLAHTLGPSYRMLLIGAGALAEYLATIAIFNGFSVAVCDPRSEYANSWKVQEAHLIQDMPDDAVIAFRPDRRSCIVGVTHDPKLDDLAILEALHSEAFYVGAIGSRSNSKQRRDRLMEHFGETKETLARLRGPIGIYIGSKTPAEIAVSVMAEILAIKNGVTIPCDMIVATAKKINEETPVCSALMA